MHLTKSSIARVCGAAAALFVLGCGSSSTTTPGGDPAAAMVGTWTFTTGSIVSTCTPLTIPPFDLTGDEMTITRVDSTHVATNLQGNGLMCDVNFIVSGSTATATAGQTCAVTDTVDGTTVTATIKISSWTLTLSGDTLANAMSGTATAEGGLLSCTSVTADGMATRASDGGAAP